MTIDVLQLNAVLCTSNAAFEIRYTSQRQPSISRTLPKLAAMSGTSLARQQLALGYLGIPAMTCAKSPVTTQLYASLTLSGLAESRTTDHRLLLLPFATFTMIFHVFLHFLFVALFYLLLRVLFDSKEKGTNPSTRTLQSISWKDAWYSG